MKKSIKGRLAFLAMVAGTMLSGSMTASAFSKETQPGAGTEPEVQIQAEEVAQEIVQPQSGASPFSIPGNGEILDDKTEDASKQFLTVQTKNGNTFFLVLDRSSNTENAYLLSMVDEGDLAGFLEGPEEEEGPEECICKEKCFVGAVDTACPLCVADLSVCVGKEKEPEKPQEAQEAQPQENTGGMEAKGLLALGLVAVCGAGAYYYFHTIKPRKEEDDESEDLEFDGPYSEEEEQEGQQEEE